MGIQSVFARRGTREAKISSRGSRDIPKGITATPGVFLGKSRGLGYV